MNVNEMTKDFTRAKKALIDLVGHNRKVVMDLAELASQCNALLKVIEDEAKTRAREAMETVKVGPITAKPTVVQRWDLDAVANLLLDEEFRAAVEIEYKLKSKGIGAGILKALEVKYPQLANLERQEVKSVTPTGPKAITLENIAALIESPD